MSQSGEKTEEATPRRREKAREDGRVASSRYMALGLQFIAGFLYFSDAGQDLPNALGVWKQWLRAAFDTDVSSALLLAPTLEWAKGALIYCAWAGAIACGSMLSGQLVISQGYFSLSRAKPDFSKLFNPGRLTGQWKEGLKSLRASMIILAAAAGLAYLYGQPLLEWGAFLARMPLGGQINEQGRQLHWIGKICCGVFVLAGGADLMQELRKHSKSLKMSKQEIKDEHKESNGRPEIKAKIRALMKQFAAKRMMQQVPQATVVITNPTHYAIAIQYNAGEMNVPLVLAKGKDHMALRIRKIALDREIPIIENPPLAQALYKSVEAGQEIPMHLYRAVAEVLAYVYRVLDRKVTR